MSDQEERKRADGLAQMKKAMDSFDPVVYAEITSAIAREKRIAYNAYVAAGFTPDQALALCK